MKKLKPIIIGFAGKPQVGKTTAAEHVAKTYGARSYFVGDAVKAEADQMLGAVGLHYEEAKKAEFRPLLDWLAMYRRKSDPDYWAGQLFAKITPPAVISDVRFPIEVELVEKSGGIVIRVVRNADRDTSQDDFPAQMGLDNHNFVEVVENNGTFEELYSKIDKLLLKYELIQKE